MPGCRCGSTTHQRTSYKRCILNKERIAKRPIDMPTEVKIMILNNLPLDAAIPLGQVLRSWRDLVSSRDYWNEVPWRPNKADVVDVRLYAFIKHGGPPGVTAAHLQADRLKAARRLKIDRELEEMGLESPPDEYINDRNGFPDHDGTIQIAQTMHIALQHAPHVYEKNFKIRYSNIWWKFDNDDVDDESTMEEFFEKEEKYAMRSAAQWAADVYAVKLTKYNALPAEEQKCSRPQNWLGLWTGPVTLTVDLRPSPQFPPTLSPTAMLTLEFRCRCGSTTHQRTSYKKCILNKERIATRRIAARLRPPIPTEIMIMILDNLPADAAVPLGQVSRSWRDLVSSKDYWKRRSWEPRKETFCCGQPYFDEDLALERHSHRLLLAKHCVCVDDSEELQFRDWDPPSLENVQRIAFIKHGGPPGVTAAHKIFKALKAEKEQEIDQAIRERGLPSPAKYVVGNDHLPDFEKTIGIAEKTHIVHKHASGVYERKLKGTYGDPSQSDDDDDVDAADDYGEEDYDYSDDFIPSWPPGYYGEENYNYSDDFMPICPAGRTLFTRNARRKIGEPGLDF
ncbi:hypothetical protein HDU88_004250 [Geranomyces variabilis]|nr:hypothetical protein HDU88_004250 [Geranomyces variabilis]